ncbi:helix-turn-helix transcriptional regulator [Halorarius litoreus]|uniref:helix-turn-helix transcriptional regulator n=1 Tax=Halorarius litoreus TaxID=2962676 RepID=UPI0020CB8B18|nr:hypothetical protein [Halorarius litoreus]
MRFGPRLALLCLLLLAAGAPVVVGHSAAEPATQDANTTLAPDEMTMTVQLEGDGDARWRVTTEFVLDNESDRRAFDRVASSFETGDPDTSYDISTFEHAAAAGRNATGREMRIEQPRYNTTVDDTGNVTVGRLTLTFRWTNFTETSGDRLRIGDGFNTTTGTWLPGLTERQTLVIQPPPGYTVFNIPTGVGIQGGTVTIRGQTSFDPGYLGQITYEQTGPGTSPNGTDETPSPGGFDLSTLGLVGIIVVVLGALAIGAYLFSQRQDDDTPGTPQPNANGGTDVPVASGAASGGAAEDDNPESDPDSEPDSEPEPDFDLLSDEERVEYLLEQNGGRMKQANIVKETGWSNAKVSQLLSAMDEAGRIDKLRIGRENLISLPDEELGEFDNE